jgi:uncharacterized protein
MGVSIAAIEAIFLQPLVIFPDPTHSHYEERFKAIGKSDEGRHIFVVFTLRWRQGTRLIRPIAARYMHRKEVEHYEKEIARSQKR